MANRTVKDAKSIKGTNPQYLVEKIIRSRIYDSRYWKEECFALTAELLVDKAMELKFIGGVFGGNIKPTPFLCLVLKMLQIQPEKDIVVEFIKNEQFKYVRVLGAFYMRLVGTSLDIYKYLEPLLNDYRKVRRQNRQGSYELNHVDEFIDELLREERSCDVILPRIQKRHVLEENNELEPRISALEDDMEEMESSSDEEELSPPTETSPSHNQHRGPGGYRDLDKPRRSVSPRFRRSRSRERERDRAEKEHNRERRGHSRERQDKDKKRHRSRSREKRHRSQSKSPVGRYHHREVRKHKEDKKERERDKERDRDRNREHVRDRNRERNRERERERDKAPGGKHRDDKKSRGGSRRNQGGGGSRDPEIAEANALRAQLGLPPLRP